MPNNADVQGFLGNSVRTVRAAPGCSTWGFLMRHTLFLNFLFPWHLIFCLFSKYFAKIIRGLPRSSSFMFHSSPHPVDLRLLSDRYLKGESEQEIWVFFTLRIDTSYSPPLQVSCIASQPGLLPFPPHPPFRLSIFPHDVLPSPQASLGVSGAGAPAPPGPRSRTRLLQPHRTRPAPSPRGTRPPPRRVRGNHEKTLRSHEPQRSWSHVGPM